VVVAALRANILVFFQVFFVQHSLAARAFDPQAFGHAAPVRRIGVLNFGRKQFFKPTHVATPERMIRL
jgi:hypothetical protein